MAKRNEQKRTTGFLAFGVGMCLLAVGAHFMTKPNNSKDFELVGKPFYEDFTSAEQARSLEVTAIDSESAEPVNFSVAQKDGVWRIPSHYDYPAEAADRLAATATSVMGIERESLAGRLKSDHERLGVLDPLDIDSTDPESVGKRITIRDGSDDSLVDFIIGKEAGDVVTDLEDRPMQAGPPEKYFYVRRPDEMQTYKVRLNVDISTKFSDWIEPDLLKLQNSDLRRISIDNYELQEQARGLGQPAQIFKVPGDQFNFVREDGFGKWALDGLNDKTEELNDESVTGVVTVLDEMKIVGVRPKHKYKDQQLLTANLQINQIPGLQDDPREFNIQMAKLQTELSRQGFNFIQNPELTLVSTGGEMLAGTAEGIVYSLNFGKAVEDEAAEIEIGHSGERETLKPKVTESPNKEAEVEGEIATTDAAPDGNDDAQPPKDNDAKVSDEPEVKNRYLMIRTFFDESLLGERPQKPIQALKPVEPDGYEPPPEPKPVDVEVKEGVDLEMKSEDDEAPLPSDEVVNEDGAESEDAEKGDSAESETKERNPAFVEYDSAVAEYEQKSTEYTLNMTRFENETKVFQEKVDAGNKRVAELNERFGDWYYVISAENLKALKINRTEVVKVKEVPADDVGKPDISFEMPEGLMEPPPEPANGELPAEQAPEGMTEEDGSVESASKEAEDDADADALKSNDEPSGNEGTERTESEPETENSPAEGGASDSETDSDKSADKEPANDDG